jgi:multidrug efflux system outer membrane protein
MIRAISRPMGPLAAALAAMALLAGCGTLEPAYRPPALPTPDSFPGTPPGAPGLHDPAAPGQAVSQIEWRDVFLDDGLRKVIALGLANNRDLRVAIANIAAARAQYRVQRAALLPTLDASASAAYGRQQFSTGSAVIPYNENQYTATAGVSSYEIDLFGRVRSLSKSALEQYLATKEARRASQITVISEIATDYLTLAADEATLAIARDTLASSQETLDLTRKRMDHGVASALDVREAETLVDQARADVAQDTTLVAQDRNVLDLVVGARVPDGLIPAPLGDRSLVLADLPPGLPSEVLLARPDVLQAEHQLKAENAQIGAARAAFFPSVTLTGSGGASSTDLASLFKGASGIWSFTPQVTVPIFDGGTNRANLDYAKAETSVYLAQYEKAIQTAFREVADALARRATIEDQLAADEAQVVAAADSLRLSRSRYERGSDTYLNLLTAQRTLYQAQEALSAARLTRDANLVALYKALGGGGLATANTGA